MNLSFSLWFDLDTSRIILLWSPALGSEQALSNRHFFQIQQLFQRSLKYQWENSDQISMRASTLIKILLFTMVLWHLGVCAGRIGWVKANISIQSAISGLEKFQSATNPPKSKSGGLVTNFGGFNLAGYAG